MSNIPTMYSLKELHDYIIEHPEKHEIFVFFDFDLTLIDDENDVLLEPQVTKDLFKYLRDNGIYHCIVTARFYDSACDDKKRNLEDMEHNIKYYIHPILEELGMDVSNYKTHETRHVSHKIQNEEGECVGLLYKGIMFGERKGEIIKHYLRQTEIRKAHPIFIDDYEPYLEHVKSHMPTALTIRRNYDNYLID